MFLKNVSGIRYGSKRHNANPYNKCKESNRVSGIFMWSLNVIRIFFPLLL